MGKCISINRTKKSILSDSPTRPSSPVVFGFGNPLLDIQFHTEPEFLTKYKLEHGGWILQGVDQKEIYNDMQLQPNILYIPGGATLNSMRVCQGMVQKPGYVFFAGCIGKDDFAKKMSDLCNKEGLVTNFVDSDNPTGICGVCIVEGERSLCSRLGAAQDFKLQHLDSVWKYVLAAKIAYNAGYVLDVCVEGMRRIGEHCAKTNKIYCTNLSAPFIVGKYRKEILSLMPYVDILFGNETEFAEFAKSDGWSKELSMEQIATRIAGLPKANEKRSRIVVVTQGSEATIVASCWTQTGLWKITKYPVISLEKELLVDTNGAGDAFVGGFLFGLIKSLEINSSLDGEFPVSGNSDNNSYIKDMDTCLDVCIYFAHMAARHVVQHDGCSFCFQQVEIPSFKQQKF